MRAISTVPSQAAVSRYAMPWLRRYFIAVGLIALGCVRWNFDLFIHTPQRVGFQGFKTFELAMDCSSYLVALVLLLFPWWRIGNLITGLAYAIVLPACVYILGGLSIVDVAYGHQQARFHLFLLSGVLAQVSWLFLRLRAESYRAEIAHLWRERLRRKHRDKIELVERFILEIGGEDKDIIRGSGLADESGLDDPNEMWKRLDGEWKRWLNTKS